MVLLVLFLSQSVLAVPGDTLKSIRAPFSCPQGLAFDGEHLWNADRRSDMIYEIDPDDGSVVDSLPTPGYVPRGLTWDGQRLWCVDAEEELIYAINPVTEIVERTIYCPVSRPTGLAWDGEYLWLAADRDDEIHQISSEDGTTIISIPAPTSHAWGLTFDGTYLWVSDRYKDMIYMITPDSGEVIVCFETPGPHSCGLAWVGSHLWNVDYQTDLIYELAVDDGTPFARTEEKMQQVEFIHQTRNFGPDTVKTLDVYLAIPGDLNNQELLEPVTFDPEVTDVLTDKWGQEVAHFRFEDLAPAEFATVRMLASAKLYQTRYFVFPDRVGTLDDIPKDIRERYLADDAKFSLENAIIQDGVKKAIGDETNPYWIGRKIFNYVIAHMEYELAGGWNVAPTVLKRGNGSCSEYSFVYIAMCRAAGLPARYAGSIVVRSDDASYDNVFHRWVEIYLPGYGWLPVDPSGGDSKWPSARANSFGYLGNRYLITTIGGGGSEYLEWSYNANERWTSRGRCKVVVENFGEWTPVESPSE
ncbi:MAG: transglutaminase [Candidatus Zixiibacteriota bacterium]|nr:MAG: transglutaminase [candidate division Zixibacteria bacterium]